MRAPTQPSPAAGPPVNGVEHAPNGGPAVAARLPLATRQRRPGYVALAVLLIVGLAAAGGWLYVSAGQKTPVVVVVRPVAAGHVLAREDLSTVEVAGGVVAVAGANLSSVVGERATVDLLANTLLQRSMVTSGPMLDPAFAQVGVALSGGQLPADGLAPGDLVQVLALPDKADKAGSAAVLVARAVVFSARADPAATGGTLVTVTVPVGAAAGVATASGAGRVALVKVAAP